MTWTVFAAALSSAFLHACWNILAKTRAAPRDVLFGISTATASVCLVILPFVGIPSAETWPWVLASAVCNIFYLKVLAKAYDLSEFSAAYAIVRALVPPILFFVGWVFFTEAGRITAFAGLLLVAASLYLFATGKTNLLALNLRAVGPCVVAGALLATALLLDVTGIRVEGADVPSLMRYSVATSLSTAAGIALMTLYERKNPLAILSTNVFISYLGAAFLLGSYLCGMWAYAQGPIGLVAPVRESGLLFGGLLAVLVLREKVTDRQWFAMGLATVGVVLVQAA